VIAGLLHYHGVWIGNARPTRFPGTNSMLGTENLDVKAVIKEIKKKNGHMGWSWMDGRRASQEPDLRERILGIMKVSPWLIKTAGLLIYPELWLEAFPEAQWIFPRRNINSIIASFSRHPSMGRNKARVKRYPDIVRELWRRQAQVAESADHFWVDTDRIGIGDEKHGRELLEFCGLRFQQEIFNKWIDPSIWSSPQK
jgi:hypothetical protein